MGKGVGVAVGESAAVPVGEGVGARCVGVAVGVGVFSAESGSTSVRHPMSRIAIRHVKIAGRMTLCIRPNIIIRFSLAMLRTLIRTMEL